MRIKNMISKLLVAFLFFVLCNPLKNGYAQNKEHGDLEVQVSSITAFSTQGYLPTWISANQYGIFDDSRSNFLIRPSITYKDSLNKSWSFSFGVDAIVDSRIGDSRIQQAYGEINYKSFMFLVGIKETDFYNHMGALTSGSFMNSRNNRPFPTIAFGFPEYTNLPLTNGYVQIKGVFEQSVLEEDRHVSNPLLHRKNFYIKSNKLPVNVFVGAAHQVMFGGSRDGVDYTPSFKDYLKIIMGSSGGETATGGEATNRLGDHMGYFDFGLEVDRDDFTLIGYLQKPFEDGSGYHKFFRRNNDRFFGLGYTSKQKKIISSILYENIYTKFQSGEGIPDPTDKYPEEESNFGHSFGGRDDYYNNYIYKSGSTYKGNVIGNPLFLTSRRAGYYFDQVQDEYGYIVNNRIIAHHFAINGWLNSKLSYKLFYTYTDNYGTYAGLNQGRYEWESMNPDRDPYNDGSTTYQFQDGLIQNSILLEGKYHFEKSPIILKASVGFDFGDMTNNFGMLLGLKWTFSDLLKKTANEK
ncbi:hypothetical protein AUTU_34400 [Aureibacter tunicatorum]|nr:hypothetical protein AUTU_34400 [Aureibacter tunicatorum]